MNFKGLSRRDVTIKKAVSDLTFDKKNQTLWNLVGGRYILGSKRNNSLC
jgi:hypothetical protein